MINSLLPLQPPSRCSIQNRKGISMTKQICKVMKDEFCQPGDEWVIVRGKPLRFCTGKIRPIPKAWTYFIVHTLESTSNQSEFIVKRCMALMEIMNHEPIDVRLLITKNIKYMDDTP